MQVQQVNVRVRCVPGTGEAFASASLANARESVGERGIARFDVVRSAADADVFLLCEVYVDGEAPAEHKATAHYAVWRDAVAGMMAEPRAAAAYTSLFPATFDGWTSPRNT